MQSSIILQGTTPEAIAQLVSDSVKLQFDELKKQLSIHEPDELMSREETLQFLKIDASTLWHWQNKGRIVVHKFANKCYYKRAEILASLTPLKR